MLLRLSYDVKVICWGLFLFVLCLYFHIIQHSVFIFAIEVIKIGHLFGIFLQT